MDAFAWEVVGSVAAVVAAAAAVIALFPSRRRRKEIPTASEAADAGQEATVMVGEIPQEPLSFQQRTVLLAALDASGPRARVVVVHAVTGMRGVGKTHLAAAYARARLAERWRLVAWINAEDLGGILAGLTAVSDRLKLSTGHRDAQEAGRAVRHWLEIDGDRCLLVFDNASDPELLQTFIPAVGAARVIITSNHRSMANLGLGVPVDVFSVAEALAFLAERTGVADAPGADVLAAELGYLPLALAQSAAVILDQHLGYDAYLDRLRAMPVAELLTPVKAGQYPRGVAAAVLMSLDGIQVNDGPRVCMAVMELLAVLSPAGVSRAMMHAAGRHENLGTAGETGGLSSEVVDRALARLSDVSLLTFSVDGSSVSAHRLVLRVIREKMIGENYLSAVCGRAALLLSKLAESFSLNWHQHRAEVRDLIEQIVALHESSAGCPTDSDLFHCVIQIRMQSLEFLNNLDDSPAQSIIIAEPLLADQERVLGASHPDTLTVRNDLAFAYQEAGRTAEAIALHEKNLADRERVLGPDHLETITSRNDLAVAYQDAGRTTEAIILHERNIEDNMRVLGADHPRTLSSRNNLGYAYQAAGHTAEAIRLHEQNLADRERVLGTDHPDTMTSRNNLGYSYLAAGRISEAIALLEQNLADRQRVLGIDHPNTLISQHNLANAYQADDRIGEAITLHEQNLADWQRVMGAEHLRTMRSRNSLAIAYQAAGRRTEAIILFEQNLADRERVLGTDHPDTVLSRDNLASAYQAAGRTAGGITSDDQNQA